MTIREVIGFADETFPNTFSNETKTKWLSQCDAEIWQDVMLLPPPAFPGYNWDEDAELDLLAPEAYEMRRSNMAPMLCRTARQEMSLLRF